MASNIENLHFLIFPLMSQSHIIPLTDFAKLIAQHGVFVSIVTTPLNAIRYKAIIQFSKTQNLKIQMIPIKFPCQEAGLPDGCENLDALKSLDLCTKFFRACELLQGPLEELIQELNPKPSCIVSTSAIPWTQKVAEKFNIPRYSFETVSCFTLSCHLNLFQSEEEGTVVSDTTPFLVPNIPHEIEFTKAQLPKIVVSDDFREEMKKGRDSAQGTLINSFQELDPWYLENYRDVVRNVWCIGPVSLCNKGISEKSNRGNQAAIDEQYCLTWLGPMRPKSVVYACFGSLCRIPAQQIKEIGSGLEKSGFPFIWIIRDHDYSVEVERWVAEQEERVQGRGLVVRGWAPQVLILSHPSVGGFVTHCGWNSTLEGICAGVPMITWPMFAEQFFNEKFIVSVLGIGVRVGVERCVNVVGDDEEYLVVKWEQVKCAIEKVMDESDEDGIERRKRAEEYAKMAESAVARGGSSYVNLTKLIRDVIEQVEVRHVEE